MNRAAPHRPVRTRRELILEQLSTALGELVVQCPHSSKRGPARTLRLATCLVDVEPYWLVDLARTCGRIWLDTTQCPAAATRPEILQLAALLGSERLVLGTEPGPGGRGRLLEEDRPPVSRREALGLRRGAAVQTLDHPAGDDPHARLVASLSAAGITDTPVASPARALQVAGCTACGVCVRACPHDALTLTHEGHFSSLSHGAAACRGEGACLRHCPVRAIGSVGQLDWEAVLRDQRTQLALVPTRNCARCRSRFPDDGDEQCPDCRARAGSPFAVHLPADVLATLGRSPDGRPLAPRPDPSEKHHDAT